LLLITLLLQVVAVAAVRLAVAVVLAVCVLRSQEQAALVHWKPL
jgi:hypothetical protein